MLDGDAEVPVADSEVLSEVVAPVASSEVWSEVGVADVEVVSSPVVVESVVGSAIGVVVVSGCDSDVVDVVWSALVVVDCVVGDCWVDESEVEVDVEEMLVLVVTPVPTTCRLGMTP